MCISMISTINKRVYFITSDFYEFYLIIEKNMMSQFFSHKNILVEEIKMGIDNKILMQIMSLLVVNFTLHEKNGIPGSRDCRYSDQFCPVIPR